MARKKIFKADGTPTPFFWTDKDGTEPTSKRVYKETDDGIKRIKNVRYDVAKNRFRKA